MLSPLLTNKSKIVQTDARSTAAKLLISQTCDRKGGRVAQRLKRSSCLCCDLESEHRCFHEAQRVHVVAPTYNLPIFNRDNRDEAVFIELAGADRVALNFILEDDDAGSLGNVHHERVCAMQRHTLSVTRIQSHEGFTAHALCWPARKSIPKLEHRIGSDRVEVVITVDKACQALPNDVKERIERGKRSIGRVAHRSTPVFGISTLAFFVNVVCHKIMARQ